MCMSAAKSLHIRPTLLTIRLRLGMVIYRPHSFHLPCALRPSLSHVQTMTRLLLQDPKGYQGGQWESFADVMAIYHKKDSVRAH